MFCDARTCQLTFLRQRCGSLTQSWIIFPFIEGCTLHLDPAALCYFVGVGLNGANAPNREMKGVTMWAARGFIRSLKLHSPKAAIFRQRCYCVLLYTALGSNNYPIICATVSRDIQKLKNTMIHRDLLQAHQRNHLDCLYYV